ncbi:MAG TPA: mucoidy inhibitor MuiA family protein [Mucilaginibacter sp.]|nr:mucoidy inhibitor MuiA family protein [Mucilaginibacter sp.]
MYRKLVMAALMFIIAIAAKADEGQKVASKVQKVTIFLKGAQVTRTAMVNINAGTADLVFGGISPDIDVQSIRVQAAGQFTLLAVKHELNFLGEEIKDKQVADLREQQKAIRNKISLQNSLIGIYQQEENMLSKNQLVKADNTTLDVVKLKQALDFQTERLTALKQKEQELTDIIIDLNTQLQKIDKQITEANQAKNTATSNILVTVSAKAALQSKFTISYVVRNAGWYPTYDIRAKNINSPVMVSYKANVSQQSGEEWKDVKLTLSTGNPAVSGNKPELLPYYLSTNMYYTQPAGSVTRVTGQVFGNDDKRPLPGVSVQIKGTTIGMVTDVNGNFSLQVPPGAQTIAFSFIGYEPQERAINAGFMSVGLNVSAKTLNEVVVVGYSNNRDSEDKADVGRLLSGKVAGVNIEHIPIGVNQVENQTNIEFNITNPYSIPDNGKQCLVEINQVEVKAAYQYYVAPKVNTDVFLNAQLTDWSKNNFLSGEANLYFEDTFIGKSLINVDNAADTLNISLGTDKNIVVSRTLQREHTQNQTFGSNKKETKSWLIEIKNRKNQPVNLLVEDQVPVSQNSSISVDPLETSGVKPDALTGKVSWNLLLNSQQDKKLQLAYQVKYPKDQLVIVQ